MLAVQQRRKQVDFQNIFREQIQEIKHEIKSTTQIPSLTQRILAVAHNLKSSPIQKTVI